MYNICVGSRADGQPDSTPRNSAVEAPKLEPSLEPNWSPFATEHRSIHELRRRRMTKNCGPQHVSSLRPVTGLLAWCVVADQREWNKTVMDYSLNILSLRYIWGVEGELMQKLKCCVCFSSWCTCKQDYLLKLRLFTKKYVYCCIFEFLKIFRLHFCKSIVLSFF